MTYVPDWRGAVPPEPAAQKTPLELLSLEEREFLTAPMANDSKALATAQSR